MDTEAIAKLQGFEGIEYWEPVNADRLYLVREGSGDEKIRTKWMLFGLVGMLTGIVATCMKQSVERMLMWRFEWVDTLLAEHDDSLSTTSNYTELREHRFTSVEGLSLSHLYAWMTWAGSSIVFAVIGCVIIVYIEPRAAGSGLPQVMGYLNGVQLPKVFTVRVLVAKFLSCMFAVGSGLPVGPEGPMIHIGSMLGAMFTSSKIKWWSTSVVGTQFRSSKARRELITCGAAAGVSAAFGAPLGGLLFVMEEIASYWDISFTWMIFFSTTVAFFTVATLNSIFHGWVVPSDRTFGVLTTESQIIFQPELALASIQMNLKIIVPAVLIGVIGGVLAIIFTKFNLAVAAWRQKAVVPKKWLRIFEPACIAFVFSTLTFVMPLFAECSIIPHTSNPSGSVHHGNSTTDGSGGGHGGPEFVAFTCQGHGLDNEYAPLATLTFNSGEAVVRHLFSRGTRGQFTPGVLCCYLFVYFVFACYTAGSAFATGIVIPMLVIGALTGRLFGEFFYELTPSWLGDQTWFDPGIFALFGSASFFAGVSRLTVSLSVILVELSNELLFLPPMMISILVAKWIADYKTHSLYHSLIHQLHMPYLDSEIARAPHMELHVARDIMTCPVVVLEEEVAVGSIIKVLRSTTYNAFPVVSKEDKTLRGILQRPQLERLLMDITEESSGNHLTPYQRISSTRNLFMSSSGALAPSRALNSKKIIDLTQEMSTSPFTVHELFQLTLTFIQFQAMGIRHLLVVNDSFQVSGIITRKDLCCIDERLHARGILEEQTLSSQHTRRRGTHLQERELSLYDGSANSPVASKVGSPIQQGYRVFGSGGHDGDVVATKTRNPPNVGTSFSSPAGTFQMQSEDSDSLVGALPCPNETSMYRPLLPSAVQEFPNTDSVSL
eukprot:TRINITY_DN19677_c0_g1_i1.p1 TRINITY_DN19677_c0_g1~~TRINITY_DN19677_c0_g1_i1.p1  ORF type:complete len:889 (+),score=106.48 TRINITY_DN19677_c0_g1_i1:172-2838(+)